MKVNEESERANLRLKNKIGKKREHRVGYIVKKTNVL